MELPWARIEELTTNGRAVNTESRARILRVQYRGIDAALKVIDRDDHKAFENERAALQELADLPGIVQMLAFSESSDGRSAIITEFLPFGTLSDSLPKLSWQDRLTIAHQLALVLHRIHTHQIPFFHRDIKSSNVGLRSRREPCLLDFGFCFQAAARQQQAPTQRSHTMNGIDGTPGYICPAYANSRRYSAACDVYSFGIVMLELLTGRLASSGLTDLVEDTLDENGHNMAACVELLDDHAEWPIPVAAKMLTLACECTHRRKHKRPLVTEVIGELASLLMACEQGQHTEGLLTCSICLNEWPEQQLFICKESRDHAFCHACFNRHVNGLVVQSEDMRQKDLHCANYNVPCCCRPCSGVWSVDEVSGILSKTTLVEYIKVLRARLVPEDQAPQQVTALLEDALNLRCPYEDCRAVLDPNPDGCRAMQCAACGHYFCWVCFERSPDSAQCHQHCLEVHGSFFIRPEVVREGQREMLVRQVMQVLDTVPVGQRQEALLSIRPHVSDDAVWAALSQRVEADGDIAGAPVQMRIQAIPRPPAPPPAQALPAQAHPAPLAQLPAAQAAAAVRPVARLVDELRALHLQQDDVPAPAPVRVARAPARANEEELENRCRIEGRRMGQEILSRHVPTNQGCCPISPSRRPPRYHREHLTPQGWCTDFIHRNWQAWGEKYKRTAAQCARCGKCPLCTPHCR